MTIKELKNLVKETIMILGSVESVYLFGSQQNKNRLSKKRDIDLLVIWSRPIPIKLHRDFKNLLKQNGLKDFKVDVISVTNLQLNESMSRFTPRTKKHDLPLYCDIVKNGQKIY